MGRRSTRIERRRRVDRGRRLRLRPDVAALEGRVVLTGPSSIPNLTGPAGIVTDPAGHVFISYIGTSGQGPAAVIGEFDATGASMRQAALSSGIVGFPGSLALVKAGDDLGPAVAPGDVLTLFSNGLLRAYRPSTGAVTTLTDIEALPGIDLSSTFDVATGRADDFSPLLVPRFASYNGLAVLGHDVLAAGSYNNVEFVLRLHFLHEGTIDTAKVVVASSALEPSASGAPGVAVNAAGMALTTLPLPQNGNLSNGVNVPVGFGIEFDQGQGRAPFVPLVARVASQGISTDALGNFVIATGAGSCPICGGGPGIVEASAALTRFMAVPITTTELSGTRAVAVGSATGTVYTTDAPNSLVWISPVSMYRPFPGVSSDYNGDGKADLAVFRPTTAVWSIAGVGQFQFGMPGDWPVPGDYTGDGKTDLAVYRPATGQWFIRGVGAATFGLPGDIPVPGVYGTDGHVDVGIYRPSTGQWFVFTAHGFASTTFGQPNVDLPVPADYDGDGVTDLAVYRPTTGQWFVVKSTGGLATFTFGAPGFDVPVPADYTGDGKAEAATYRPSSGTWWIQGVGAATFGQPNVDWAVPADYTGTGHASLATFRPPTAEWYIAGKGILPFGMPGLDVPASLPCAYWGLGFGRHLGRSASPAAGSGAGSGGGTNGGLVRSLAMQIPGPVVVLPAPGPQVEWPAERRRSTGR